LHVGVDQLQTAYRAHNMYDSIPKEDATGAKHYEADGGRPLIEKVSLWREGKAIPLTDKGRDERGALVYEADTGQPGLDGLVAQVDLALFDDRRSIVFALYAGDYAADLRRAAAAQVSK
jgi:hypothetical protein